MSGVYPMLEVTVAIDFGEHHAIDAAGNVYCILGPGVIIRDGYRTQMTHGFRLFFSQQCDGGPQLQCISCGRPAPLTLINPDRLPGDGQPG